MNMLNERERAFEAKFAHDAEMQFNARVKSTRQLGLWAADQLGKTAEEADTYATYLVREELARPKEDTVFNILRTDLDGIVDAVAIRTQIADQILAAKAQLVDEHK